MCSQKLFEKKNRDGVCTKKLYAFCRENRFDVWLKLNHAIKLQVGKCGDEQAKKQGKK